METEAIVKNAIKNPNLLKSGIAVSPRSLDLARSGHRYL